MKRNAFIAMLVGAPVAACLPKPKEPEIVCDFVTDSIGFNVDTDWSCNTSSDHIDSIEEWLRLEITKSIDTSMNIICVHGNGVVR
jgi:hypothetical protein